MFDFHTTIDGNNTYFHSADMIYAGHFHASESRTRMNVSVLVCEDDNLARSSGSNFYHYDVPEHARIGGNDYNCGGRSYDGLVS